MANQKIAETKIVLRFRDLATNLGGTIAKHRIIIESSGGVWWGWWSTAPESPPRQLFADLVRNPRGQDNPSLFLFHSFTRKIYLAGVEDVRISPLKDGMRSPNSKFTPEYYCDRECMAWFFLKSIEEKELPDNRYLYHSFPSLDPQDLKRADYLLGKPFNSKSAFPISDLTLAVLKDTLPEFQT